ncbi:pyridoxal phosphate homeostasis protein-like [Hydractinia symbiolongicarpus]|uniref:pyridoxal phosphate homeostasis protein-like n=1 Tax=Hydractinia symbiolongicarpus TaxID=13093 RepID=UPI00254CDAC4|nr:pyridoxal phosphate homeostasis protein-like [Hydractinia symbiolongicarpus]
MAKKSPTYIKKSIAAPKFMGCIKCIVYQTCKKNCNAITKTDKRPSPCLVAVSKTKPHEMIKEAYQHGQRDFGENYVQELVQKATYFKDAGYEDIRWHFIGHLQRNKVNNLLGAPNLEVVQTVDSIKLADALNKSWQKKNSDKMLKVFAQLLAVFQSQQQNKKNYIHYLGVPKTTFFSRAHTYGQTDINIKDASTRYKSGCTPTECTDLVKHIQSNCDCLSLQGLMTIGSFREITGPNPDFICLVNCRKKVCEDLKLDENDVQLSMGMSHDYEKAILAGSTTVRIGSTIFGSREKNKDSKDTMQADADVSSK